MTRIIIHPTGSTDDLFDCFARAVRLLTSGGLKPLAGMKLVSRYGVIVVDAAQVHSAIERLRAANMQASSDL
jgi:hypothetical protein